MIIHANMLINRQNCGTLLSWTQSELVTFLGEEIDKIVVRHSLISLQIIKNKEFDCPLSLAYLGTLKKNKAIKCKRYHSCLCRREGKKILGMKMTLRWALFSAHQSWWEQKYLIIIHLPAERSCPLTLESLPFLQEGTRAFSNHERQRWGECEWGGKWGKVSYSLMSHFLVSTSLFKKKKSKNHPSMWDFTILGFSFFKRIFVNLYKL